MPVQCEETVKNVASPHLDGDKDAGLPRDRMLYSSIKEVVL